MQSRHANRDTLWGCSDSTSPSRPCHLTSIFPTCQFARFYVSAALLLSSSSSSSPSSTASVGWQCSSPDLNRQLWMAAFPAGPKPPAPDGSVPRRNSTASTARQCSPPDLNPRCVKKNDKNNVRRYAGKMSEIKSKNVRTYARENFKRYARQNVKRYARQNVRRYARKNVRKNVSRYAR